MPRFTRYLAPLALSIAVIAGACNKGDKGDKGANALGQDSTLNRDLALANRDSASQPQLNDVPAAGDSAAAQPAPAAPTPKPKPKPRPRAPRPSSSAPSTSAPAQPAQPTTTASGNSVSTAPSGNQQLGEIPAGSLINLTSNDKICTNTNKAGDRFTGTVTDAVVGSNGAVIPAGSKVVMEVTALKRSGNTTQPIEMTFNVINVAINGTSYPLTADIENVDVDKVRNSSTGKDAAKVAGGAVVGAIIGQIIGHNTKGTVIGAAAGAAAGTGVAMATAGYEGCVPSGGKISLKLTGPATVAAQ